MRKTNKHRNFNRAKEVSRIVWRAYETSSDLIEVSRKLQPHLGLLKAQLRTYDTSYWRRLGYQLDNQWVFQNMSDAYNEFCYVSDRINHPNRLNWLIQLLEFLED